MGAEKAVELLVGRRVVFELDLLGLVVVIVVAVARGVNAVAKEVGGFVVLERHDSARFRLVH